DRVRVGLGVDGGHDHVRLAVLGGHGADRLAPGDLGEVGAEGLDGGGVRLGQGPAVLTGDHSEHGLVAAALHGGADRGGAGGLGGLRQRVHTGDRPGAAHPAHHGQQYDDRDGEDRPGGAAPGEDGGDPLGESADGADGAGVTVRAVGGLRGVGDVPAGGRGGV